MRRVLDNTTALITGAASGIGRQLALDLFRHEGCNLILVDRDGPKIAALAEDLKTESRTLDPALARRVEAFACDVGDPAQVDRLINAVGSRPIDLLINNAGIAFNGTFESSTAADFERLINVNLLGAIRITRGFLSHLLQARDPVIANIASLAGLIGAPGMSPYATSKFGLVGFSESLSAELRGRVHVATICPAFVKTDIARNSVLGGSADDETGRKVSVERMDKVLKTLGSGPMRVSRRAIRAIKNKEGLVLITPHEKALFYLKKFLPSLSDVLVEKAYGRLLKAGVIRS